MSQKKNNKRTINIESRQAKKKKTSSTIRKNIVYKSFGVIQFTERTYQLTVLGRYNPRICDIIIIQ